MGCLVVPLQEAFMPAKQVVDIQGLLALNEEFAEALMKGEKWAIDHIRLCESLNAGEPEGFRRPFDGNPRKWCGGACPFDEGCVTCTLPEDPEMVRLNEESRRRAKVAEGVITISGEVNSAMVDEVRKMLDTATANGAKTLQVEIQSDGGNVTAGLRICDMIRDARVEKRIGIVREYARSMALIILQACDERIAASGARLLLHYSRFKEVTIADLRDPHRIKLMLTCAEPDEKRMDTLLEARTGRSTEEIRAVCEEDADMTSEAALHFGLIDSILQ